MKTRLSDYFPQKAKAVKKASAFKNREDMAMIDEKMPELGFKRYTPGQTTGKKPRAEKGIKKNK